MIRPGKRAKERKKERKRKRNLPKKFIWSDVNEGALTWAPFKERLLRRRKKRS